MTPEAPVGFYRTIAITFLVLTIALLGVVIFFTSKKATIVVVAKTDNKNVSLEIPVAKKAGPGAISGTVTSAVFAWTEKYYPTGNKEEDGTATGEITIYNKTSASQTLVKITRFITADGVLFRLANNVLVPANGQIIAGVYADGQGAAYNIGPSKFTIPGLSAEKQKYIYGESAKAMTGGTRKIGVLAEADIKQAELDYLSKIKEQAKIKFASPDAGVKTVVDVKTGDTRASAKAGDQVSEFFISGTSTLAMVSVKTADLNELVAKEVRGKVDVSFEKVLSVGKEPVISLANYDLEKETARIAATQDVLATIDVNGSRFAASNFFGKKKDEIERDIMGISHVVGVEVKFSPSWMRTAPSVGDRIKVIVKNVK